MPNLGVAAIIVCSLLKVSSAGDILVQTNEDQCTAFTSCTSCITQGVCTWCITKSLCTRQQCGNDNIIYPKNSQALLTGAEFCPRIVESPERIFKHSQVHIFVVKLTQIYVYMAFTPWQCKIRVGDQDFEIKGILLGDSVYCDAFEMKNESDQAYIEGNVKVLWNFKKAFDGSLSFKICRCDLEPNCLACTKNKSK
ncbi:Plexin-A2 [Danaus plexippus plexippus]|uniref:Plexin-A2 n=1 Tax=Danaus plexippus plexippus TaxID=278856 RepID=A0A212FKG3_DANPL|nr:uncharacterized protein LOC116766813 [Danaus plexippus plexippus]OWR54235.1 Plexin-A2 [Danaus plexippus plexippus]